MTNDLTDTQPARLTIPELAELIEDRLRHGWRAHEPDLHPDKHVTVSDEELLEAALDVLESLSPEYTWQDQPRKMNGAWRTMDPWRPDRDTAARRRSEHPFTRTNPTRMVMRHVTEPTPEKE